MTIGPPSGRLTTNNFVSMAESNLKSKGSNATARECAKAAKAFMRHSLNNPDDNLSLKANMLLKVALEKAPNDPAVLMAKAEEAAISAHLDSQQGDTRFLSGSKKLIISIVNKLVQNPNNEPWQTSSYKRLEQRLLTLIDPTDLMARAEKAAISPRFKLINPTDLKARAEQAAISAHLARNKRDAHF